MARRSLISFEYSSGLFVKRTTLGAALDVLLKLKGFVFLPFYTRMLGATGMGLYAIITSASVLLLIVFTLNITSGLAVYTSALRDPQQIRRNYSTTLNTTLIFTAVSSALLLLIGTSMLPENVSSYMAIVLLFAYSILGRNLTIILPQMFQRARVLALTIFLTEYSGALVALGLVAMGLGPIGLVGGLCAVNLTSAAVLYAFIYRDIGYEFRLRWDFLRKSLAFSLPLVPYAFSGFILDAMDKFFLYALWSTDQVGIYQVGYSGASFVLIAASAISFTFTMSALNLWAEDPKKFYSLVSNVLKWLTVVLVFMVAALFTGNHIIVDLLGGPGFFAADAVVPILGLGMCATIYNVVFVGMFNVLKESRTVMYIYIVSAVANLVLNFLLVPSLGIIGASIAMAAAYWLSTVLLFTVLRRRFELPLTLPLYSRLLGVGLVLMVLIWAVKSMVAITLANMLLLGLGVTVLYAALLLATRAVSLDEVRRLIGMLLPAGRGGRGLEDGGGRRKA